MPAPGPILLYRPGGLGDLLVTLPAIRLARDAGPGRPALLAALPAPGRLLMRAGAADDVLSCDDPRLRPLFDDDGTAAGFGSWPSPPSAFWAWLVKEPPLGFRAAVARLFGDEGRIIVHDPASGLPIGRSFFSRTAEMLGLKPDGTAYEHAARLPDFGPPRIVLPKPQFAVIHPGSGGRGKNWPLDRFLDVAAWLRGRGLSGFFITGPAEGPALSKAGAPPLPEDWGHLHEPPLADLAGLLARCGAYLGNDSGVTHLAAAAGAPVLALFRDGSLPAWRPCGRTVVLSAAEPSRIPVSDVLTELARYVRGA